MNRNQRVIMGFKYSKTRLADTELWGVDYQGRATGLMNSLVYRLEKTLGDKITWIPETSEFIIEEEGYEIPDDIDKYLEMEEFLLMEDIIAGNI